jgi:GTPase SAR1 family protein
MLASQLKLKYYEVSAKTGKKVNDLFDEALEIVISKIQK